MTLGNVFRTLLATAAFVTAGLASANAQPVTLKIWMHEHPPRIPIDKSIVAEFEKANPDIKLDYQVIGPADYPTKLLTAFASSYPLVFAARLVDVILADSFAEPMMKVLRTLLTRSSPCRAELGHKLHMLQKPALPSMRRRA